MSIKSNAFGRITLTAQDAAKFKRQVVYGRPAAAAVESVKRGLTHSERFKRDGRVRLKIKAPA